MRRPALEKRLGACLGTPIILVRSEVEIDPARLHRAERDRLSEFSNDERKRDWLLGRNALKQVLSALDRGDDTQKLTFPDGQISLSHAGHFAFAAGIRSMGLGVGIDYEPKRVPDRRAARWFLDDRESAWLGRQPGHARNDLIVRLWTIKEAAFKSHPDNAGMTFTEFAISEPAAEVTNVVANGRHIRACSCAVDSGYLSVAISGDSA